MSAVKMGDAKRGERNPHSQLTTYIVACIRSLYATGNYTQRELATMFGVRQPAISRITTRKRWSHV